MDSSFSEPIHRERLVNDAHRLNQEILRLASALGVDLTNQHMVIEMIHAPHLPCDDKFHKCETLKGLIILRGKIAMELRLAGHTDPVNPVDESIYKLLTKSAGTIRG
jgi:hypothetical protein